ncbi:cytochrome P450 [Mollisia scopiformis]|uniref:Cytochrome P450 n=1 Tax=Mollisia scopiformis TaxID=149040 RepID=A0A194XVB7_MOLSC|nr:cytochrome P450 [Mollisia scopiformis]KUJ24275.1 cytochrome P450 [Mollisia scopiformis]
MQSRCLNPETGLYQQYQGPSVLRLYGTSVFLMERYLLKANGFWVLAAVVGAVVISQLFAAYYHNGLNRYPGPLLAKFTRLAPSKVGDVVRIGPNSLSVSNPAYVPRLYGVSQGFLKSEMYDPFAPRVNGKRFDSSLSVRDPKVHQAMHKPIANAYSLTTLIDYEPLVDKMIIKLLAELRKRIDGGNEACDIGLWMRLYAFDVMLQVTLSDTLGFMDKGGDINGFFERLDDNIDRSGLLVTMPWTAYLLKHNPIVSYFSKDSSVFPGWTASRVQDRLKRRAANTVPNSIHQQRDFLGRFIEAAHMGDPPKFDFSQALNWTLTNVMAGVSWARSQHLPYLDAVIKESLRMHPAIGLGLERTASGLEMPDGYVLPPGTNVGMNSWVVNRQAIFGDDVDEFVPERWLQSPSETEAEHKNRLNRMKRADLGFGAGSRSCTGKYVSYLEIYKVIPSLLLTFDMEMVDEKDEWTVVSRWTVRQDNIRCFLRQRGS